MRNSIDKGSHFSFGAFTFFPGQQLLLRGQRPVKLGARAFEILHCFVANTGELITKEALVNHTWPKTFVDPRNLKVHISSLRRALGETWPQPTYIATVPGRGYRFVAPVTIQQADEKSVCVAVTAEFALPERIELFGRDRDVRDIGDACRSHRLVTLVGPCGIGKTALAIEAAHQFGDRFSDGICFINVARTDDLTLVPHVIANSLGLRCNAGESIGALTSHLEQRRVLLVLDECDLLLPAVADFVAKLLNSRMLGTVLATCREPLSLDNELVRFIGSPGSNTDTAVTGDGSRLRPAVEELFVQRAREASGYMWLAADDPLIGRLCQLADGVPLCIEELAQRTAKIDLRELVQNFEEELARYIPDDGPRSERELWERIRVSYQHLTRQDALLFQLVAVFAGSFDADDAVHIAKAIGLDLFQTSSGLARLVNRSLISADAAGDKIRYEICGYTRSFGRCRLRQNEPVQSLIRQRHAQLTRTILLKSEEEWNWMETSDWLGRYEVRSRDLADALNWCFGEGQDSLLGAILTSSASRLWQESQCICEQIPALRRAVASMPPTVELTGQRAKLASVLAWAMTLAREFTSNTEEAWQNAIALSDQSGDLTAQLATILGSAVFLMYRGRGDLVITRLERYFMVADRHADPSAYVDGRRLKIVAEVHSGMFLRQIKELEKLAREMEFGLPPSRTTRIKQDRYVGVHGALAFSRWLTGDFEPAMTEASKLLISTSRRGYLFGQAQMLSFLSMPILYWLKDSKGTAEALDLFRRNLMVQRTPLWKPIYSFFHALHRHVEGDDAISDMQAALSSMTDGGFLLRTPSYLGFLAEALHDRGHIEEALRTINRALEQQRILHERWCLPELMRIKAKVVLRDDDVERVLSRLRKALAIATEMGARFYELRILCDLIELSTGKQDHASAIRALATLCAGFNDETHTADLVRARELLSAGSERLAAERGPAA